MSKVTSKRQVTIPKEIADRYGIEAGDEIDWMPAGDTIRLISHKPATHPFLSVEERLELFDRATERQLRRQEGRIPVEPPKDRGWRREDLYDRGRPR
ncbi:MAG: AbrB/MazE/SpoVT family DNA-binding domain-containing protein [Gemmatimonadota bacterium]